MSKVFAGTVVSFSGTADKLARFEAKGVWLKCDGRPISKVSYPALFAAIGTTYGGDGNPNFVLPDMRAMFLRGVDDGRGFDLDRDARVKQGTSTVVGARIGSFQGDQLRNHQHSWDHFFFNISHSGNDIAVHQPSDSGHTENNTRQATNNDGGGSETRPKNISVYFLIATGAG